MGEKVTAHVDLVRLKPSQVERMLRLAFDLKQNVLLLGSSGIGKTDVVDAAFNRPGEIDFHIVHPVIHRPEHMAGLPTVKDGQAHFVPFDLLDAIREGNVKRPTVVFADDFTQARPDVQASWMQVLWRREINGHKIDPKVWFALAGNRPKDQGAVQALLDPLKKRCMLLNMIIDNDDWLEWAAHHGIHPALIAFHKTDARWFQPDRAEELPRFEENSPCPRATAKFSDWVFRLEHGDRQDLFAAAQGLCGSGYAAQFTEFLRLKDQIPTPEEIFRNPKGVKVPTKTDLKLILVMTLGYALKPETMEPGWVFLNRPDVSQEDRFTCITYASKANPEVGNTKQYTDWCRQYDAVKKTGEAAIKEMKRGK